MFCRGLLLSTLLLAVIFVSTLDAKKCNNFQLGKSVKKGQKSEGGECSACTGYICKIGGKNILGTACTEDVKEICQQNWDDSKLESIANEKKYQSEKGKYFVFSCQEDECNSVQWVTDSSSIQYAKEVAASDLSLDATHGQRFKRQYKCEKEVNGVKVPCPSECAAMTEEERKKAQKDADLAGAGIEVCPDGGGGGEANGNGVPAVVPNGNGIPAVVPNGYVPPAVGVVSTPEQCAIMTEEERKIAQEAADVSGLKITICPDGVGGGKANGNGVEKVGYGIGVFVATLGYFFFINL